MIFLVGKINKGEKFAGCLFFVISRVVFDYYSRYIGIEIDELFCK